MLTSIMVEKEVVIWGNLKGTDARGVTKEVDLGKVQEIGQNFVLTEKGTISKEKFFIPKYLVEGYDGHTLWFRVSEGQKTGFFLDQRDNRKLLGAFSKGKRKAAAPFGTAACSKQSIDD